MCTAVAYQTDNLYFGRTLDLESSCQEQIVITPRNCPISFRKAETLNKHFSIIGMAFTSEDIPLYFDAMNEKGLCAAGLNFPDYAVYQPEIQGFDNIAPFEFIPWILGQCTSVDEARTMLSRMNLAELPFREDIPLTPLHWILSDTKSSITVEPLPHGIKIYDNSLGILTNSPPFDWHMLHLQQFMQISQNPPVNLFSAQTEMKPYSRGMGAVGLPGDYSSSSRFIRAAFLKLNSPYFQNETDRISQFFHIMDSVTVPQGSVRLDESKYEITQYTSCCDTLHGIYYYTTYENRQISGINMFHEDLDSSKIICYPLKRNQQIQFQNSPSS